MEFYYRPCAALPRIETSAHEPRRSTSRQLHVGVTEQLIFPEIDYDKVAKIRGMDITIVTTAASDDEGQALLSALGFPFTGQTSAAQAG